MVKILRNKIRGFTRHNFSGKNLVGFTLVELLVVIGILSVLLAIVLIAINPARQFAQANDTQRRSDVNAILNAIHQYAVDHKGVPPSTITTDELTIAKPAGTNEVDLCTLLVPTYLADLPIDPTQGTKAPPEQNCTGTTSYNTKYTVQKSSSDNRITVTATPEVSGTTIRVTR